MQILYFFKKKTHFCSTKINLLRFVKISMRFRLEISYLCSAQTRDHPITGNSSLSGSRFCCSPRPVLSLFSLSFLVSYLAAWFDPFGFATRSRGLFGSPFLPVCFFVIFVFVCFCSFFGQGATVSTTPIRWGYHREGPEVCLPFKVDNTGHAQMHKSSDYSCQSNSSKSIGGVL